MADEEDTARDKLREALPALSEEQARTVLGWLPSVQGLRQKERGSTAGPLADLLGITSETSENGRALFRLKVKPDLFNPYGVLHGGAIYTLVDYSMGSATTSLLKEGQLCATIEVKINYLSPTTNGVLTAQSDVVRMGRSVAFVESRVTDDGGRLVATASGSFFITGTPRGNEERGA